MQLCRYNIFILETYFHCSFFSIFIHFSSFFASCAPKSILLRQFRKVGIQYHESYSHCVSFYFYSPKIVFFFVIYFSLSLSLLLVFFFSLSLSHTVCYGKVFCLGEQTDCSGYSIIHCEINS